MKKWYLKMTLEIAHRIVEDGVKSKDFNPLEYWEAKGFLDGWEDHRMDMLKPISGRKLSDPTGGA